MTERAWTPGRVDDLLHSLRMIGVYITLLTQSNDRLVKVLEKALNPAPVPEKSKWVLTSDEGKDLPEAGE